MPNEKSKKDEKTKIIGRPNKWGNYDNPPEEAIPLTSETAYETLVDAWFWAAQRYGTPFDPNAGRRDLEESFRWGRENWKAHDRIPESYMSDELYEFYKVVSVQAVRFYGGYEESMKMKEKVDGPYAKDRVEQLKLLRPKRSKRFDPKLN